MHHDFPHVDQGSGRTHEETLEIHTLELGWYFMRESDLEAATLRDPLLYWLLHANEYEFETLDPKNNAIDTSDDGPPER